MIRLLSICFMAVSILATGCVYKRQAVFNQSEYDPYNKPGTGMVTGQAFLKTLGGDVKYGAGNPIFLNPVTSYSTEWFNIKVVGNKNIEKGDARASNYLRQTIGDGEGRFKFKNLPEGKYYLACPIYWSDGRGITQGADAFATVDVKNGEVAEAILTR